MQVASWTATYLLVTYATSILERSLPLCHEYAEPDLHAVLQHITKQGTADSTCSAPSASRTHMVAQHTTTAAMRAPAGIHTSQSAWRQRCYCRTDHTSC